MFKRVFKINENDIVTSNTKKNMKTRQLSTMSYETDLRVYVNTRQLSTMSYETDLRVYGLYIISRFSSI